MNRRNFLRMGVLSAGVPLVGMTGSINGVSWAAAAQPEGGLLRNTAPVLGSAASTINTPYRNLLILVELKGANDGLNTV